VRAACTPSASTRVEHAQWRRSGAAARRRRRAAPGRVHRGGVARAARARSAISSEPAPARRHARPPLGGAWHDRAQHAHCAADRRPADASRVIAGKL
jgi:hypothetical protein